MTSRLDLLNAVSGGTVLGGLCPEGGEVRRWNSGRLVSGAGQATNKPNLPAGRGYNGHSQRHSPAKAAQVPGRGGAKPLPIDKSITLQSQVSVDQNYGRLTPPPPLPANRTRPGITAIVQTREHYPVSIPQAITTDSTSKEGRKVSQDSLQVNGSPSRDISWVPPHLRKPKGGRSTASPSPTVSRPTSPRPNGSETEDVAPSRCEDPHKITSLSAREIFFQDNIQALDRDVEDKLVKARIVIYELLDAPLCLWELVFGGKKIIRGDIRDLLQVLQAGSVCFLRRSRHKSPVQSHHLQFSGIDEAVKLQKEVDYRRLQYADSIEPFYNEVAVKLTPAQCLTDCKKEVLPAGKVEKEPTVGFSTTAGRVLWTGQSGVLRGSNTNSQTARPGEKKPMFVMVSAAKSSQQNLAPRPKTPPGPTAINHQRTGSGWSDKDLISFSPGPPTRPQHVDDLAGLELKQTVATEARTSSELSPRNQEDSYQTTPLNPAEEVTKALRNIKIHTVRHLSLGSLEIIDQISGDYDWLIQRSRILSIALDKPYQEAAYTVTLSHLVEKEGFLSLTSDEQKKCFSVACSIVRHGDAPIVRSAEEIRSLRTGEEPCPNEVEELNALIQQYRHGQPINQVAYRPHDIKATNGHRRSSTADTMSMLANQLESLTMK